MAKSPNHKSTLPRAHRANIKKGGSKQLKNVSVSSRRFMIGLIGMIGIFIAITTIRLVNLQLSHGKYYSTKAIQNQTRQVFNYAPRGLITDTKGNHLVDNKILTQAAVVPYLWQANETSCNKNLPTIAKVIGKKPQYVTDLVAKNIENYNPQLLARNLNRQQMIALSQLQAQCPALNLSQIPSRHYVTNLGLAQVLGYVGQPSASDLANDDGLLPSDFVGKTGLEDYYDKDLRGQDGVTRLQVDALGRVQQTMADVPAKPGKDIQLNIDVDLQKTLHKSLADAIKKSGAPRGAAVALNPQTGAVLAMVSSPEYNNNLFTGGISQADYKKLINNPAHPLVDTAVSGGFPSGSVIKPIVASAALQAGIITPQTIINDKGYISVPNVYDPSIVYRFNGWALNGLGPVDVVRAIALSSDIFFYTIGGGYGNQPGLGVQRLTDYYKDFGLGKMTGIDLPFDSLGRVPTPAFKQSTYHQPWTVGDTYNISIGQGDLSVSPLQMALADMAVINNGYLMQPQLVHSIDGKLVKPKVRSVVPIDKKHLAVARQGMIDVIKTFNPSVFAGIPGQVAGKTGTAETAQDRQPNAWFIGYAPADKPKIEIAVFVQNAGAGSDVAAPVAAAGLKNYLTNK